MKSLSFYVCESLKINKYSVNVVGAKSIIKNEYFVELVKSVVNWFNENKMPLHTKKLKIETFKGKTVLLRDFTNGYVGFEDSNTVKIKNDGGFWFSVNVLIHELVHVSQMNSGRLKKHYNEEGVVDGVMFDGKFYDKESVNYYGETGKYSHLPYEVEAHNTAGVYLNEFYKSDYFRNVAIEAEKHYGFEFIEYRKYE